MPVLNGFSGSLDTKQDIYDAVDTLIEFGGNCYRMAFNPAWAGGTRPWGGSYSGIQKIQDFLDYAPDYFYVICDANHWLRGQELDAGREPSLPTTWDVPDTNRDWQGIQDRLFEALNAFPDHPRVIMEIINEYDNSYQLFPAAATIVQNIKAAGFSNPIMLNSHTNSDTDVNETVWSNFKTLLPNLDYYGRHWYFDNLNDPTTKWNTLWKMQEHMNFALQFGCTPICNTEIGASFQERYQFTEARVGAMCEYIQWGNSLGMGSLLWMDHNLNNIYPSSGPSYLDFNSFNLQWVKRNVSYSSTPIEVAITAAGKQVASGESIEVSQGIHLNLKAPSKVVV